MTTKERMREIELQLLEFTYRKDQAIERLRDHTKFSPLYREIRAEITGLEKLISRLNRDKAEIEHGSQLPLF